MIFTGACGASELVDYFRLNTLKTRDWHLQTTCAVNGNFFVIIRANIWFLALYVLMNKENRFANDTRYNLRDMQIDKAVRNKEQYSMECIVGVG